MYRAVFNLAENAVKYRREGSTVQVISSYTDNLGTICVRDTGIGIPGEDLSHIFESFYRAGKSRARKTGGAGLELAVVKAIIERHGWSIFVKSTAGIGTEFEIRRYNSKT